MHRQVGYLNYLSNSNLDYNNPLNVRRFGAYAGLAVDNMSGIAIQKNPVQHMAGLAVENMAGIPQVIKEKPLLYAGMLLLSYPTVMNLATGKKRYNKKGAKELQKMGAVVLLAHFVMPMLKGE